MKILTIAEQKGNELSSISFEPIGIAKSLDADVCTALLCGDAGDMGEKLAAKGSKVFLAVHSQLAEFQDEAYAMVLKSIIDREQPDVVIGCATFYGKALLGRLAALCEGGLASDCTGLSKEDDAVIALKPAYGGNLFFSIQNNSSSPFFISIRPKAMPEASDDGGGEVIEEAIDESLLECKAKTTERITSTGGKINLNEADIIVAAGRGIRGAENIRLIEDLADTLGAAVGASRAIVDADWIEYSYQIGQTGKTVNPKLYFAVGISGAIQHLVGMRSSKTIVAINRDKDAPIFSIANYGIVGDLFEIVPALTRKFKK